MWMPRRAVLGLSIPMTLSSLGTSSANVALPAIAHAFDATPQAAQWVTVAYLLALTVAVVAAGQLGDRLGRRRVLRAAIVLFAAASAACAAAPTLGWLIVARAVQGVAAAALMALTVALVHEMVPAEETGRVMGWLGAMSAVGTALGPSLGGVLIAVAGWPAIFLVNVPLAVVALLVGRGTPALARATRGGVSPPPLGRGLVRQLRDALATSALVAAVLMATLVVGPFHLSEGLGLDPARVGLLMSVGPIAAAAAGVPAGRLVDRLGSRRATRLGLAAIAIACAALALGPATVAGYVGPIVVLTTGYALFQTANNTAAMTGISSGQRGAAAGLLGLSRNVGLAAGAAVLGGLFASTGLRLTFAIASGLVLVALGLFLVRGTNAVAAVRA